VCTTTVSADQSIVLIAFEGRVQVVVECAVATILAYPLQLPCTATLLTIIVLRVIFNREVILP
jgi:hypothetical protein